MLAVPIPLPHRSLQHLTGPTDDGLTLYRKAWPVGDTWSVLERPVEEQITAVENREAEQLESVVEKLAREALETRLVVGAIIRFALNNQTFPATVQNRMDDYEEKAIRIWDNRQVAIAKIQAITDHAADPQTNPLPDLDADWTA